MKQQTGYLKNAAILTGTGLVLRAAGMLFRIYIAGRLGGEGMGLYQLILSLYNLAAAAACAGISVAATRLTAEELAGGDAQTLLGMLHKVLQIAVLLGCAAGAAQYLLAWPAAKYWLGDCRAAPALRILAPSLPFMAVAAALRGYFLGRRQALPGAKAQLLEQLVRIPAVVLMLERVFQQNPQAACTAVLLGNTLSEVVSCLWLLWFYHKDCRSTFAGVVPCIPEGISCRLRAILLPVEGGRCLSSALQAAENMLVPACLAVSLCSRETALAQYGALKGMALPLLFFPFSFLSALSALLMPEITAAWMQKHQRTLQHLISRMLFITMVVAVPVAGLFTACALPLGQLLYHNREVGVYLRVLGPLMPCMYLESMVDGVLKGMGQQMATFRYSMWDSVLRIAGVVLLLPHFGMDGFLAVMVCSNLFTGIMNTRRMLNTAQMKACWGSWVLKPLLVLGAALLLADHAAAALRTFRPMEALLVKTAVTGAAYVLGMLPLGLGQELRTLFGREKDK